jgi:hypothetical protein
MNWAFCVLNQRITRPVHSEMFDVVSPEECWAFIFIVNLGSIVVRYILSVLFAFVKVFPFGPTKGIIAVHESSCLKYYFQVSVDLYEFYIVS